MNEQFSSESFPFVGDFFGDHGYEIQIKIEHQLWYPMKLQDILPIMVNKLKILKIW